MKYILQLLLLTGFCLHAQTKDAILAKVTAEYAAAKPLQFTTVYNLYKTTQAKNIEESYKGTFYKNAANDIYLKINTTEYLVNNKLGMQVNHDEKVILVAKSNTIPKDQYDINNILKTFNQGAFTDKKTYWEIELLPKQNSRQPYSKIVLHIGKDYFIKKQIFYYRTGINFSKDYSKEDIHMPKLEVVYGKASRGTIDASKFDTSSYFSATKKGIKLTAKYSNYELIDQR